MSAPQPDYHQRAVRSARPYRWASAIVLTLAGICLLLALFSGPARGWGSSALFGLAMAMALFAVQGLKTGVLPGRFGHVFRNDRPRFFRFMLWTYVVLGLGYGVVAVWLLVSDQF